MHHSFQTLRAYQNHVKTAHDAYVCDGCNQIFEKKGKSPALYRYERHRKSKCGKPQEPEPGFGIYTWSRTVMPSGDSSGPVLHLEKF